MRAVCAPSRCVRCSRNSAARRRCLRSRSRRWPRSPAATLQRPCSRRRRALTTASTNTWSAPSNGRRPPGNHVLTLADTAYPRALLTMPDPPPLLYVKGRLESAADARRRDSRQPQRDAAGHRGRAALRSRAVGRRAYRRLGARARHRRRRAWRRARRRREHHRRDRHGSGPRVSVEESRAGAPDRRAWRHRLRMAARHARARRRTSRSATGSSRGSSAAC